MDGSVTAAQDSTMANVTAVQENTLVSDTAAQENTTANAIAAATDFLAAKPLPQTSSISMVTVGTATTKAENTAPANP